MTMAAPTSIRQTTPYRTTTTTTTTALANNNHHEILKYSVLYTSKIHNKNPANQDGVLFYHTRNWRLRLHECDKHGNMGMEIALDFRKMDQLQEGDELILAGKYRVMVDELLNTETVAVGPLPASAAAAAAAAAAAVASGAGRDAEDGGKRKRNGLRPGEMAHGQTDRALKDVIREQNESMNQKRRQQLRAGNRQWTASTASITTTTSNSSIGSWQQNLQQLLLQQQQYQNQHQQEQQPPRKKPDHTQSRQKPPIEHTQLQQQQQHQLHQKTQPPQRRPSNRRAAESLGTAAIALLDAALDDQDDLNNLISLSELDDMPDLSSDGEVEVLDVTRPGNHSIDQQQQDTAHQQAAAARSPAPTSTKDKVFTPIDVRSSTKNRSPKKTVVTSSAIPAARSPTSLRPPSFAKSKLSTSSFGTGLSGGGLRCLQGMLSRSTPRPSLLPPPPADASTTKRDNSDSNATRSKDQFSGTEDFRAISAKVLADLNQVEADLKASIQKNASDISNTKDKSQKSNISGEQNNHVLGIKATDGDIDVLETKNSPKQASKSTKIAAADLDYFDNDMEDIDFSSDPEPVVTAAPVKPIGSLSDKPRLRAISSGNNPALQQNQNLLPRQLGSKEKDEFDDYDFTDEADTFLLSPAVYQVAAQEAKPVPAATKVREDDNIKIGTKNNNYYSSSSNKKASKADFEDSSSGQQESKISDEIFENDETSNSPIRSPDPAVNNIIMHSPTGDNKDNNKINSNDNDNNGNGDDVVMTQDSVVSVADDDAYTSSVVEIQPLSLPSLPASSAVSAVVGVNTTENELGAKSPGQCGKDGTGSTSISSSGGRTHVTENASSAPADAMLVDSVPLTLDNSTTPPPIVTDPTSNATNDDNAPPPSLSSTTAGLSPHSANLPTPVPRADSSQNHNSAVTSPLKSKPAVAAVSKLPPSLAIATATAKAASVPLPLRNAGFGRPKKRAPFSGSADSTAGLATALTTSTTATSTPANTSSTAVIVGTGNAGSSSSSSNSSSSSGSKNNPQFVPPVSKTHHLLQQQRLHTATTTTNNNNNNNNSSSTGRLEHRIEPVVLVAEEYGAWTAETMDLFSWRPV